jgi:hypothetical protein
LLLFLQKKKSLPFLPHVSGIMTTIQDRRAFLALIGIAQRIIA